MPSIGKDDFKRTAVLGGLGAITTLFNNYFPSAGSTKETIEV